MKSFWLLAAGAAAVFSAPAAALDFTLSKTISSFSLPSHPSTASVYPGVFFTTRATQNAPFSGGLELWFSNAAVGGGATGFNDNVDQVFALRGPQLYVGPEAAPTFRTGAFALANGYSLSINGDAASTTPLVFTLSKAISSFSLPSHPTTASVYPGVFFTTYATQTTPFSGGLELWFSNATVGGGITGFDDNADQAFALRGPQFYTGPEAAPTFRTGTFALEGGYTLSIVDPDAAAVPEPATWAMLVGGFGLIGASVRRRGRVAFA